ncbi:MAG: hypothetical protein U0941_10590 [Planctomycetaceae bacterium]
MQVIEPDTEAAKQFINRLNEANEAIRQANAEQYLNLTKLLESVLIGRATAEPDDIAKALPAGYVMADLIDDALTRILGD